MHIQRTHSSPYLFHSAAPYLAAAETPVDADTILLPYANKPTLLLIEDHGAMVDGMLPTLEKYFAVGVVNAAEDLPPTLAAGRYALAIVDLTLHRKLQGLEMMPLLRAAGIRFFVFSGTAEAWHIHAAIRLGARGFVDKRESLSQVLHALQEIHAGRFFFSEAIMQKLRLRKAQHFPLLGPGEQKVIQHIFALLAPGSQTMPSNKLIANAAQLSVGRVENILQKLNSKFNILDGTRDSLLAELKERGYFPGASLVPFGEIVSSL